MVVLVLNYFIAVKQKCTNGLNQKQIHAYLGFFPKAEFNFGITILKFKMFKISNYDETVEGFVLLFVVF